MATRQKFVNNTEHTKPIGGVTSHRQEIDFALFHPLASNYEVTVHPQGISFGVFGVYFIRGIFFSLAIGDSTGVKTNLIVFGALMNELVRNCQQSLSTVNGHYALTMQSS